MVEVNKIRTIINTIASLIQYHACQEYAIILNSLEIRLLELSKQSLLRKECNELLKESEYLRSIMVY